MNEMDKEEEELSRLHAQVNVLEKENEQMMKKLRLNDNEIKFLQQKITNHSWNLEKLKFYDAIQISSNNSLHIQPLLQIILQYLMHYRFTMTVSDNNNLPQYITFNQLDQLLFNTKSANLCGIKKAIDDHIMYLSDRAGSVIFTVSINDDNYCFALIQDIFNKIDDKTYVNSYFGSLTVMKNSNNGDLYDVCFRLKINYLE